MPTTVVDASKRPTFITKPNSRFATTMLSTEYRDYAVRGEEIVDKATGELFIKRPVDGKIISFHQNHKFIHDLVLELRVLLTNNLEFIYPKNSDDAFYISKDFDVVTIQDEKYKSILDEDTIISNATDTTLHQMKFKLSKNTNGFFCKPMTRDTDKAVIEFLTNKYNSVLVNYDGDNSEALQQKNYLNTIEKWADSNVVINYTAHVTDGANEMSYEFEDYIRLNEEMCILLPLTDIRVDFPLGFTNVDITINSFSYEKIRFIMNHRDLFGSDFNDELNKFICPDNKIQMNNVNFITFVDSSKDIDLLGNENIIALLDIPYVRRYMSKMSKLKNSSEFIQSTYRPSDDDWSANTVWAERVRDVLENGVIVDRDSEISLSKLEEIISKPRPSIQIIRGIITTNPDEDENYYLESQN